MQPGTAIVFTTLAPDCTYDANVASFPDISQGSGSQPQHPSTTSKMAMFTSMTSGNLAKVYLGLTNADTPYNRQLGALSVDVFLMDDTPYRIPSPKTGKYGNWLSGGGPNIASQTYLGRVTPAKFFKTTNNSLVSLVVAKKVPVVEGQSYWLVLQPVPPGPLVAPFLPKHYVLRDCWNYSSPRVRGMHTLYSEGWYNGYNWWAIADKNPTLPAFGLTAWPRPWADFFRDRVYEEVKVF